MKIRILGAGFYGCHIASALMQAGHNVEVHEAKDSIFAGASGSIPARLHLGYHYPRSRATRVASQTHRYEFMKEYGFLTRLVPMNLYAIAKYNSLVDFGQYKNTMKCDGLEFIALDENDAMVYGLENVEGALLTTERHIVSEQARVYFEHVLDGHVFYGSKPALIDDPKYDYTIDCTFCANDGAGVDRYEPCIVGLVEGPTNKAVTIMDGPFSSLYPWNELMGLNSLSSAKWSPFSKECKTWEEANYIIENVSPDDIANRLRNMMDDITYYLPEASKQYEVTGYRLSIRAMPKSGADARLIDVVPVGERAIRVRAGKIDAIIQAAREVMDKINA